MAKLIAKTYGDALFEVAVEGGLVDTLYEEAFDTLKVLRDNPELLKLFGHPGIDLEEKLSVVESVFTGTVSPELVGLMRMAVEKGRDSSLEAILEYFITRVKEYKKIGIVRVSSAMELTEAQKKRISEKILATTEYVELETHYSVDASLIGGVVIRIGDRVADGSVKNKLYELKRDLSKIQLA